MKQPLPIGVQTFSEVIRENYCYVDKTPLLHQLVTGGKYYFISRPRRFGKSLMVSTLASLFAGERELFKGLSIEPLWDWSQSFPVINISFGGGTIDSRAALDHRLRHTLRRHEEQYGLTPRKEEDIPGLFSDLIIGLHQKFGQRVVLLIDEYDKPILDNLVAGRDEIAIAVREGLKGFYAVIKDSDQYVRFALLTGVSKFSKVSLFSG
ncbi:MAG: AAA family ATPase, partial [Mariprofundaceae bacterium]|nr:AAA family ATPase [Mariprofundaceae bacterium]